MSSLTSERSYPISCLNSARTSLTAALIVKLIYIDPIADNVAIMEIIVLKLMSDIMVIKKLSKNNLSIFYNAFFSLSSGGSGATGNDQVS